MGEADVGHRPGFFELRGIRKAYAGNTVLDGIDYTFESGRVYGILGENGAGKSTLTKIIAGLEQPNEGHLLLDGERISFRSPSDALAAGITVMTQEQTLVPERSVAENVFLGQWERRWGLVRDREVLEQFHALRDRVGFSHLQGGARTSSLSLATRQQVEILRAIARRSRMIIMDEPTAILSSVETQQLLELIRELASEGIAILLISHFLEDVLSVADDVLVLRDGGVTLTAPAEEQTPDSLTEAMVGREVSFETNAPEPVEDDAPVRLRVVELVAPAGIGPVSLEVRAGEIVGLAGLVGAGRTELARAIFGADPTISGWVEVEGRELPPGSIRRAIRRGLGMVSENRKEDGLSLIHSIRENTSIVARREFSRWGVRAGRAEREAVGAAMAETRVKATSQSQPVWSLSGGNQQKVLFAKWTVRRPRVLIVDEPTRGVDVGAKLQIHRLLRELAAEGLAILLISSEVEEVIALSHRVLVMREGKIVDEIPWAEADRTHIIRAAFGGVAAETHTP